MSKVHPPFAEIRIFTTSFKHLVWCFHEPPVQRRRMMAVCRFSLEGLEPRRLLSGVPGDILNVTGSIPLSGVVDSPSPAAGILAQPAATPVEIAAQPETNAAQALITTVPASGAQLTQSPDSLVVTFNQQDNIGQDWWLDGNVQLDQDQQ